MSKQIIVLEKNTISTTELARKKERLENARATLKSEMVGIDSVIDDVIHAIEAWYVFPQGQIRPTIINLFGMTGVGKTSLVNRLCELIGMDKKLYRFDVGDYADESTKLKYDFSNKLKNNEKQPVVLMFDEFQLGRTIDDAGCEVDRTGLRALWDLLDNGKIAILNESYYTHKVISLCMKLQHCIENDVEAKQGVITKNQKFHNDTFYNPTKSAGRRIKMENEDGEVVNDLHNFVPDDMLYNIRQIVKDHTLGSNAFLRKKLASLNHLETVQFLTDVLDKHLQPTIHDFSQALIFIIGNLDEVYNMSSLIDPDYDADTFYENSLNISVTEVKEALKTRFRVEQIARLGNNHIIYPAFSSLAYKRLIKMELEKFQIRAKERYGIEVEFDGSVHEIIYREGVFPTQGTRPVFTTISSLIESYISKIVSDIVLEQIVVKKIVWSFNSNESRYEVKISSESKSITKTYELNLKVDSVRQSTRDDAQAHTAVHEAGHAVVSCMHLNIIPDEVVSKTTRRHAHGFCRVKMPDLTTRELIKRDMCVGLGGFLAEKMLFGEEDLSTSSVDDIRKVTEKAIGYVKFYGMHDLPVLIGMKSVEMNHSHFFDNNKSNQAVADLVEECMKTADKVLRKNKLLLLKISEYLSENSRMDGKMVLKFVEKYTKEHSITTAENYYSFKSKLKNHLKKTPKKSNKNPKKSVKLKK